MKAIKVAELNAVACSEPESQTPALKPLAIATGIFNVAVPLFFAVFAWKSGAAFVHTLRFSNLIMLITTAVSLQFYVRKSTTPFISTSAYAWLIALCGTIAPLLFRPSDEPADLSIATVIQVIGGMMQIYVLWTLNRAATTPAPDQGIQRDVLNRFVRHPLCLTFVISQFGYVLNHTTLYNLGILTLAMFFQILRINEEERLLESDEKYQDYVHQTPWKLIPHVF